MESTIKLLKSSYKSRRGQKTRTAQQNQALKYPQEIRHPVEILKTTFSTRGQYLMGSSDPISTTARTRLRDQIALLRAMRSENSPADTQVPDNAPLQAGNNEQFLHVCQSMLDGNKIAAKLHQTATINTFMRNMIGENEDQLAWARRMAWIDMLTRFYLPFIYDAPSSSTQRQNIPCSKYQQAKTKCQYRETYHWSP